MHEKIVRELEEGGENSVLNNCCYSPNGSSTITFDTTFDCLAMVG